MTRDSWDGFVLRQSPGALFQSWEWGEVEKKLGHKVWRMEWPGALAQVVKVPARRGTFLHVRHGPVFSDEKVLPNILDDLAALARKERAWFVRISPQVKELPPLGLKNAPIHAMDAEICWVLDLTQSEEALLMGMRKTTRYEIKHASGVKIEKTKDLNRFLKLYNATSQRQRFVGHTGIREEFETLDTTLYVASHQGVDLAAAIIVYFGDEAIYHHGASVPSKIPASYLLQWEAIREAKKRGMKVYNFWGIAPDERKNHPWWGLTAFKMGFGGRRVQYIHAMDLPVSALYVIPKTIEGIRKRLKGY